MGVHEIIFHNTTVHMLYLLTLQKISGSVGEAFISLSLSSKVLIDFSDSNNTSHCSTSSFHIHITTSATQRGTGVSAQTQQCDESKRKDSVNMQDAL